MYKPFKYSDNKTPDGYECKRCLASGVRLYRKYQTVLSDQDLFCMECAIAEQKVLPTQGDSSIGWRVAAVPTEDGHNFWGFTSVPDAGVNWWYQLPTTKGYKYD